MSTTPNDSLVLTGALVRTSDPARPAAGTVVVEHGRISHVGELPPPERIAGLPVHDLGGRTVLPGFVDAHTHPSMVTKSLWHVRLPWTSDVDELLAFIRDYAAAHPVEEAPFLYFEYYPTRTFADAPPTKELLDTAVSDRPVLCQDSSDHEHWVNSRMLELMGVTAATPDPLPGLEMFARDEHGEPTGRVHEMAYVHFLEPMFEAIGWRPPEELTTERIEPFFRFMTEHGVTAMFEALVEDEEILRSIAELDRRGELLAYYDGAVRFRNREDLPDAIERLARLQAEHGGPRIRMNTLKLFLDGTNESGNSALLAPLCRHAGTAEGEEEPDFGSIALETEELTECLLVTNAARVDVHIHLVGDRAFRVACDAVEAAQRRARHAGQSWELQVTLAHCELVDPADLGRPAELGVLINWTCHWSGGYFGDTGIALLGRERWDRMYRFTEVAASGATLSFASDVVSGYELHRAAPLFGMQVAATRVDPEEPIDPERFPGGVRPDAAQRLDVETLLRGYTIDAAKQLRLDDRIGSIEVGKIANLTVLGADPLAVDPAELGAISVDAVLFEGRLVAGALPG